MKNNIVRHNKPAKKEFKSRLTPIVEEMDSIIKKETESLKELQQWLADRGH